MRRLVGIVACAALLAMPTAQAASRTSSTLVITGQGGQSAELLVPRAGLTIGYPSSFETSRLPGDDTAVGGVAFQRSSDGELAGGVLLHNAPGFEHALAMPLIEHERTQLPAGRFRLTLLGTGPQTVRLQLTGGPRALRLVARGPARPVTRVVAGASTVAHQWEASLGRVGRHEQVVIGAGAGGPAQQAVDTRLCVRPGSGGPCVTGEGGTFFTPGVGAASGWFSSLYGEGSLQPGTYGFSGYAAGAGASKAGHLGVVISLPR